MIDSVAKLKAHLEMFKRSMLREGRDELELYPLYCIYYNDNKDNYKLPNGVVLSMACEVLIEG